MAGKPLTEEQAREALAAVEKYGTVAKAAAALGLVDATFRSRVKIAKLMNLKDATVEPPDLPEDDDVDTNELIDMMCKRFDKRHAAHAAKKWMTFKVKSDEPIGITWFGDPHVDDNGCNWPLLKQHCDIVANTPGMYGANIGDVHNNWVGRLARLYADQDTSRGTALKLAEWFLTESGVEWFLWLIGNHDDWNYGSDILKRMAKNICPMIDWRAQFKIAFPNGRECLIDAAHNHKGHSQWNSLHGQQKASSMGGIAHLYIAGHLHNWALAQNQCSETGRVYHLARCRGYKFIDSYALVGGFGEQPDGASIVTVIDPKANEVNFVRCFADVKEGADYLIFLRSRR